MAVTTAAPAGRKDSLASNMSDPTVTPDQQVAPGDAGQSTPQGPAQPPAAPPSAAAPSQPPAPTAKPSKWANVVKGALAGLEEGGVVGAVGGALDPQRAQAARKNTMTRDQASADQAAADVRFKDQQSAYYAQMTNIDALKTQHLPEEFKQTAEENAQKRVQFDQEHLGTQYQAIPNTPDNFQQYLSTQTASQGGASLGRPIVSPTTIYIPKTDGGTDTDPVKKFQMVQSMATAIGVASPDRSTYFGLKPQQRQAALKPIENVFHGFNPDGSAIPYEKLPGAISRMQTAVQQYTAQPGADKTVVDQLKATVADLQNQKAAGDSHEAEKNAAKTKVGTDIAEARGRSMANNRIIPVLDENGNLVLDRSKSAMDRGLAPAQQGIAVGAKQSQLNDIETGLKSMRDVAGKLDSPLTPEQVTHLTIALHSNDEKAIGANIKALANQNLSPAQKDFVVAIAQLNERAMSLRNIAGMGQGSDEMRRAIQRMLPSAASGDRDMMNKQLDALDQQVKVLHAGIPKVKGLGSSQPSNKDTTPKDNGGAITHVSSDGKWAYNGKSWIANPKK